MLVLKRDLGKEIQKLTLIAIGDTHIGDEFCDMDLVKESIAYVKKNKWCYIILNGDLINNALKNSKSDVYGDIMSPEKQIDTVVELLKPVKDRILAITEGNHEKRSTREVNLSPTAIIARELGLKDIYTKGSAYIFLRFGENNKGRSICYTIYANHGRGGGRSAGGKLNSLPALAAICDADVYIHHHTHLPAIFKMGYMRQDPQNSTITKVTKLFVNGAGFLDYGGYGEENEYPPSATDNPKIYLGGKVKSINGEV